MTDWQLPAHIHDHLAPETHWLEGKRRALLDLYFAHGYQLIMPPMAEYQEALAQGGLDVDRRMIKVVDHLSGRMLGLRPDLTPQAARIDAHVLAEPGVTRLCYSDRALHARPATPFAEREPWHVGAEIYGEAAVSADAEVIRLLDQTLARCGIDNLHVEVHHMGLIRELANVCGLSQHPSWADWQGDYWRALQNKDQNSLAALVQQADIAPLWSGIFSRFINLFGDTQVLAEARQLLGDYPTLSGYLQELQELANTLTQGEHPVVLQFDLSDGRGYHYHTGIMFSAYAASWSQALAHGGRYDGFGARFGRRRAATGFTLDLFEVARLAQKRLGEAIYANLPFQQKVLVDQATLKHPAVREKINSLRAQGIAVVVAACDGTHTMPAAAAYQGCQAWLVDQAGEWSIVEAH